MVTMLRALGIEASPALVNTDRRDFEHELPNAGAFDHVITRVHFSGLDYWLDPTRSPQQGSLYTASQPDYARALVLDDHSTALTPMPAATMAAHAREVEIDVDSRAGVDQPVKYVVRTTYGGFSVDTMRDDLGDGERSELQRRYVNFYATSYPGIQVAVPFDAEDDILANVVVVTEHYTIKDFWPADGKDNKLAHFHVSEINGELRAPEEPIRTMPLSLRGPQTVLEQVQVHPPMMWPDRKFEKTVANDAFKLTKVVQLRGRLLTTDYILEITKDQIKAADVARFAADIGQAQDLLGYSLSTDEADAPVLGSSGTLALRIAGGGAVLLLATWWGLSLRRARNPALEARAAVRPVAAVVAPPQGQVAGQGATTEAAVVAPVAGWPSSPGVVKGQAGAPTRRACSRLKGKVRVSLP